MPRTNGKSPDLCREEGCSQPRFQTEKHRYPKCEAHMREMWRKYNNNNDPDAPPRRERPAARKSPARGASSGVGARRVPPIRPAICPFCRRSLSQAAHFALRLNIWCGHCTPISTPRAEIERRAIPAFAPPLHEAETRTQFGDEGELAALRAELAESQRELRILRKAVNEPQDGEEFQVLILDFEENCIRYLTGYQQRREPFPSERDKVVDLQINAARNGYILARRHKYSVILDVK